MKSGFGFAFLFFVAASAGGLYAIRHEDWPTSLATWGPSPVVSPHRLLEDLDAVVVQAAGAYEQQIS